MAFKSIKLHVGNGIYLLTEMRAIIMKLQEHDNSDIEKKYPVFFKIKSKLDNNHCKLIKE